MHTRLSVGVSKGSLALDYGQVLRDHVVSPLVKQGAKGVDQAVSNMRAYSLMREDLDGLLEVTQWPDKSDPFRNVDSKTKAALTRKYNKEGAALPYSIASTVSKKKIAGGGMPGDEEDIEEDEGGDDITKDANIKIVKGKGVGKDEMEKLKGLEQKGGKKVEKGILCCYRRSHSMITLLPVIVKKIPIVCKHVLYGSSHF